MIVYVVIIFKFGFICPFVSNGLFLGGEVVTCHVPFSSRTLSYESVASHHLLSLTASKKVVGSCAFSIQAMNVLR